MGTTGMSGSNKGLGGGMFMPTKLPGQTRKTQTNQNDTPSIGSIKATFSYYQQRNPIQHPLNNFDIYLNTEYPLLSFTPSSIISVLTS